MFLSGAVFSPVADLMFVACCVLTNRKAGKAGFGCLPWQVLLRQSRMCVVLKSCVTMSHSTDFVECIGQC